MILEATDTNGKPKHKSLKWHRNQHSDYIIYECKSFIIFPFDFLSMYSNMYLNWKYYKKYYDMIIIIYDVFECRNHDCNILCYTLDYCMTNKMCSLKFLINLNFWLISIVWKSCSNNAKCMNVFEFQTLLIPFRNRNDILLI